MSEIPRSEPKLRDLKAMAQRLEPILRLGRGGLSDTFVNAVNGALSDHELIKIKFTEHKEERKELARVLAERTTSRIIMQVGHVVVLYRKKPSEASGL